jgi:GDP-L-fucose synthase
MVKNNSKVLVCGGTGLVGSAIARELLERGYRNVMGSYLSRDPSKIFASLLTGRPLPSFTRLDLTAQAGVESLFSSQKPTHVYLAAAKVGGILANNTYPAEFIYSNLAVETNVIHSAYKHGVEKLLFLGSSCIYPKFAPQPMKEEYLLDGKLEPTNEPYAIAKIAGIKMCAAYNRQYGTDFLAVMPTNLYGPHDRFDLVNSHVLPALIRKFHLAGLLSQGDFDQILKDLQVFGNSVRRQASGEKVEASRFTPHASRFPSPVSRLSSHLSSFGIYPDRLVLWGTGDPRREFLHVDDLAQACVYLMENYHASEIGEFVNIGMGEDIPIKDLADMVRGIVGFDGEIFWDTSKPDGTPRKLLDVSRIRALGWEPRVSLKEGITDTYRWYLQTLAQ